MDCSHETVSKDPRLTSDALRRRFATLWVIGAHGDFLFMYASEIIGSQTDYDCSVAAWASSIWRDDAFVHEEMRRLREEQGTAARIPSKEALALEALELSRDKGASRSERLQALKLVNDIMGYSKPGGGVSVDGIYTQSVMIVPDKGDEEQWSASLKQQQRALVAEANAAIERDTATQH